MKRRQLFKSFILAGALISPLALSQISISEFHYDNDGADSDESIELSGPSGTELSGWELVLYNGSPSQLKPYNTLAVDGILQTTQECDGNGFLVLELPANGLQNGAPDGIALVNNNGTVVEFISYEGEFTPNEGPAAGMTSTDIGVSETASTPVGYSLQKNLQSNEWFAPQPSNFGNCDNTEEPPQPTQHVKIHQIQGSTNEAVITGPVSIEAIVTASFQSANQLKGFFVQEEVNDQDSNPKTSEGIFIYCDSCPTLVSPGDLVTVSGEAEDYFGMTQILATSSENLSVLSNANTLPPTIAVQLPIQIENTTDATQALNAIDQFYEQFEGMLVTISGPSIVSEYYQLGRYGEVLMTQGSRPRQFTDYATPSEQGLTQHTIDLLTRQIVLDDGSTTQNPNLTLFPLPNLSANNFFRGGDRIDNLSGPLNYAFNKWRIQAAPDIFEYNFLANNPRPESPDNNGSELSIASYNVLNYFTTIDQSQDSCSPNENMECRGADSNEEFIRQQEKLVAAICQIDADIVGLMELENARASASITPVEALVTALNGTCPGYSAIVTGPTGNDAITVGVIYKSSIVSPVGEFAVLETLEFLDPLNTGQAKNRPALAQTFTHNSSGEKLTVVVNHLKSKGSACGEGDDDKSTGQGNCNGTRTAAAQALVNWLAQDPTNSGTDKTLIMGDLNAYRKEDPIQVIVQAGFTDIVDKELGEHAYSYVFDGQTGYLDHALVSDNLLNDVIDVAEWHINADEISLFDYNGEFKPDNFANDVYTSNAFRSSDHDPIIIYLQFNEEVVPSCQGKTATIYVNSTNMIIGGPLSGTYYSGTLIGTKRKDVIVGTSSNDLIIGYKNKDIVCAGDGDDVILGGAGNDSIDGESGHDFVIGGRGKDFCDNSELSFSCE